MSAVDWKDARTHRDPAWPVGRYAPGNYIGKCRRCDSMCSNMDKRALYCFPCAIEALSASHDEQRAEISRLKAENDTLRATIQIVTPSPSHAQGERG